MTPKYTLPFSMLIITYSEELQDFHDYVLFRKGIVKDTQWSDSETDVQFVKGQIDGDEWFCLSADRSTRWLFNKYSVEGALRVLFHHYSAGALSFAVFNTTWITLTENYEKKRKAIYTFRDEYNAKMAKYKM